MTQRRWSWYLVLLAMLLIPTPAFANMGPPIFYIAYGLGVVATAEVVIVGIETPVLRHFLSVSWRKALLASAVGNAASAVVGLCVGLVVGNSVIGFLMEALPYAPSPFTDAVFTDVLISLLFIAVFFVLSTAVEWPVVNAVVRPVDRKRAFVAVVLANAVSHLAMAAALFASAVLRTWPGV